MPRLQIRNLLVIFFTVLVLLAFYKHMINLSTRTMDYLSGIPNDTPKNSSKKKSKLRILLYTAVLSHVPSGNTRYVIHQHRFVFNQTLPKEVTKEGIANNKKYRYNAHKDFLVQIITGYNVVIFHVKDMPRSNLLKDVSKNRPVTEGRRQIWAYFNKESPYNTINTRDGRYDGIFNMMIAPNRHADVFAPYGFYKRKAELGNPWRIVRNGSVIFNEAVDNLKELSHFFKINNKPLLNPSLSIQQEKTLLRMDLKFEEKNLLVAWVVSNCKQKRDYYVRRLLRHLPIHIYGKCARHYGQNRRCYKNEFTCERLLRRYKFVLAFENSFCEDYISDKYWNAVFRGNVPVVLGGSEYDDKLVIPGSFINARSFNTSASLAKYIFHLSENKVEYNKYLRWRKSFAIDYIPNDHYRLEYVSERIYKAIDENSVGESTYNLSAFYDRMKNCPLNSRPMNFW